MGQYPGCQRLLLIGDRFQSKFRIVSIVTFSLQMAMILPTLGRGKITFGTQGKSGTKCRLDSYVSIRPDWIVTENGLQPSVAVISRLLWCCFITLCDWLEKLAPLFLPMRSNTKSTYARWRHTFSSVHQSEAWWWSELRILFTLRGIGKV